MDEGWIKLYRKFLNWGWFKKSEMVHLFVYILLKANGVDREYEGMIVKRGQFITSRKSIHDDTGLSEQTIRTCLKRLERGNEISVKSTKAFTLITVSKYDTYNVLKEEINQQLTNGKPTSNQQLTTTKKERSILDVSNETSSSAKADVSPKLPKKQSKSRKKDPKDYTLGYKCRLAFVEYFEKAYGEEYYYAPKDAKAMQNLIKQITFSRKSKDMPTDDESIVNALKLFLSAINKTWINNNFTVTNISSQYNSIISEIKNRKNNDNRQETSDRRRGYDARTHSAEEYEKDF